jgi:enoyl-CoA hydratase/carnithine racemase
VPDQPAPLTVSRDEGVALLTLNRPEKRNALSIELRELLVGALRDVAEEDTIGCAVLTGAGTAFCSGMDRNEFGGDLAHKERLVEVSVSAFATAGEFPKPLLAAVNGPALAGGFALALLCDLRIAAESATFGFPELPRGIPPSYASARAALSLSAAADVTLTGRVFGPEEALRLDAVNEVVPDDRCVPRSLEVASTIAAAPRTATLETKRRILLDREREFGPLFTEEGRVFREVLLGDGPDDDAA